MSVDYFAYQELVAKNLVLFMREKGFSRLSLSKVAGVPRTTVDNLLNGGWNRDALEYNTLVERIQLKFNLPKDYFLKEVSFPQPSVLGPEVQELFDGLDNILDIYSMYLSGYEL
ncbi:hypothetical protein P4H94_07390 [Paenibacillus macerans]|uniref:Helix-turn-helix family protein n=1 Tax=Paenibacillus macerans TaxID=44252 RepID=A0A6N8ETD3_PAEMA|nr:hypothetical protein [Paenibacillus macerans]MEC0136708.1 hypothetical protein [Paenibacillus macerans]MED4955983.1 hypothetical protein [Paenibacillus macerans]MUG21802.1 hypothetical protein [Paenibacillus macerans]